MGMSSGSGGKGAISADINVTPLIDVLLVLLIIFLVLMPIMMKKEQLTLPRKIDNLVEEPDPDKKLLLRVKLRGDASIVFNDGLSDDETFQSPELATRIRAKLALMKQGTEKVVFVDFEDGVKWLDVVQTMDSVRSLATDKNFDEIKVALTICDSDKRKPGSGCEAPK